MRPGCGEHSDPPRSPLEQLARRFLAPPSQGLRGLRMDEALERRQLDARPGASARGHVPTVPRLCPHPAHLRPSHIAATGCRSRPHGARMVSDGLRGCGPQVSNLDRNADYPFYAGYLRRFPRFARTILLDKRGGGVSDREVGSGSPENRMDDVRAVLDAVGCQRAALLGQLDGGPIAILFAATFPDRVSALVLIETAARRLQASDYPEGLSPDEAEAAFSNFATTWGTGRRLLPYTTDAPDEAAALDALAVLERSVGTPRSMRR